jgi:hypothetical protein
MITEEQLDEARAKEAGGDPVKAARLAREGWTPPEPVDPDILAFRDWVKTLWPNVPDDAMHGSMDYTDAAKGFVAGARMAREQERERAKVLVEYIKDPRADMRIVALAKYEIDLLKEDDQ